MASRIGVPRVTVYLLVGLVLGPHVGQRFFDEGGLATELLLGPHTEVPLRALGVISYEEVKNTLYDPMLRDLVIAGDLTSVVEDPLEPESSLATALEVMDRHRVQSGPGVEDQRLLGSVSRTDLYSLMRRS